MSKEKTLKDGLIVFAKKPVIGQVKTRLAREIGEKAACEIYRCFLEDLFDRIRQFPLIISCEHRDSIAYFRQFQPENIILQRGNDLGEKMYNSFWECFGLGYEKMVLIGSDSPDMPLETIQKAFSRLEQSEMVLAPSNDGGFYLIGFRKGTLKKDVFMEIHWSTTQVWEEMMFNIEKNAISCDVLDSWYDLDEKKDLLQFYQLHQTDKNCYKTMAFLKEKGVFND